MTRISFIIPVFNDISGLEQYCKDIELHFGSEAEILIIDDGSDKATAAACDEFVRRFDIASVCHQENQGVSAARNRGIALAEGSYLVFLDGDDSIDAEKLYEAWQQMQAMDVDLWIFGMCFEYYRNGSVYRTDELKTVHPGLLRTEQWLNRLDQLFGENMISSACNKIHRTDLIRKNHLMFPEDMFIYEDLVFELRCLAFVNDMYVSDECIYHYRQAEDEGNASRRLKRVKSLAELIGKVYEAGMFLSEKKDSSLGNAQLEAMVSHLYMVLLREKISGSDKEGIQETVNDTLMNGKCYINESCLSEKEKSYLQLVLDQKVSRLIFLDRKAKLRHAAAVRVKSVLAKVRG